MTRLTAALAAVFVIALLGAGAAPAVAAAGGDTDIDVTIPAIDPATGDAAITNAQLRWGLNREAGGGAFFGGCNFLSAGVAGDSGSARVWNSGDGLYAAESGAVRIERAVAGGGWTRASFDTRCLDPNGTPVSVGSLESATQNQVVIDGGTGGRDADGLTIRWTGGFTVAFYGGLTYWSASDPQLTLDPAGNGRLTATASGYGTSMEDMTKWEPLAPREIVLAEVRGAAIAGGGFSTTPEYLGVSAPGQVPRTGDNAAHWGAFPASFVAFQQLTGQAAYWFTSGGQRDPAKPSTPLIVNYDAAAPAVVPASSAGADGGSSAPSNDLRFRPEIAPSTSALDTLSIGSGEPLSFLRRAPGLVPDASEATGPLPLVFGGVIFCALVSVLAGMSIAGRLRLPWSPPPLATA